MTRQNMKKNTKNETKQRTSLKFMDVQVVLEGNKSDERAMKLFELLVNVITELSFEHDDESEKCLASKNKVNQDSSFMYQ